MTYSNMDNVPTQTAGTSELLASDWNTYVRDNFDAIKFGHVVVADATARTNLGNVAEGTMVYQSDNNKVYVNSNGTTANWVEVADLDNTGAVSDTSQGYFDGYAVQSRNVVINGAMQVAQRATSKATLNAIANYFTCDRWYLDISNESWSWTNSIATDAPTGSGFRKSFKVVSDTGDNSLATASSVVIVQKFEGQNLQHFAKGTSSAKKLAFQCWVKASITGTFIVELVDRDNNRHVCKAFTVDSANTWEKKTFVFPADTTGALDNDNAQSMDILFWIAAGTNWTSGTLATSWASLTSGNRAVGVTNFGASNGNSFQITGVQLEAGDYNTPFEFEPYETTLRKCQRYYFKVIGGAAGGILGWGMATAATASKHHIRMPDHIRTAPSSIDTTGTGTDYRVVNSAGSAIAGSGVPTLSSSSDKIVSLDITTATGLTAGNATYMYNQTTDAYIGFSSEL